MFSPFSAGCNLLNAVLVRHSEEKTKNKAMKKVLACLIVISLFICSCEKENEVPKYVGTWTMEQSMEFMGMQTAVLNTMEITENTVESIGEMTVQEVQVPAFGYKADLLVSGNQFTMNLTAVGTGNGTGGMIWIDNGAAGWDEALAEAELTETIEADYVVVANKLTLNISGGVPQIFTKQ
jgi:formate/nitrite transporter FocA (FNT family)